ncbi:MAG: hypothetical protein EAZ08_04305 [Cytophagales bacterium]|nr:MAG: hypothetical protein EAZ08_04305 [Cytophagales bacterium]
MEKQFSKNELKSSIDDNMADIKEQQRKAHKGKIPHYKAEGVRGKISFKRKELIEFLEKGRKATASERDAQAIEKVIKISNRLKSKK